MTGNRILLAKDYEGRVGLVKESIDRVLPRFMLYKISTIAKRGQQVRTEANVEYVVKDSIVGPILLEPSCERSTYSRGLTLAMQVSQARCSRAIGVRRRKLVRLLLVL